MCVIYIYIYIHTLYIAQGSYFYVCVYFQTRRKKEQYCAFTLKETRLSLTQLWNFTLATQRLVAG